MPPLHPAFVHFPIALVAFSFVTDLLGRLLNKPSLRSAGFWSLIGALVGGAVTAATGYYDFGRDALGDAYRYVDFHMDMGWILLGCVVGPDCMALVRLCPARTVTGNSLPDRGVAGSRPHPFPGFVWRRDGLFAGRGCGRGRQRN